jgi:hypothetical protein
VTLEQEVQELVKQLQRDELHDIGTIEQIAGGAPSPGPPILNIFVT